MSFDDDLLEGLDDFEDESFLGDEFEDFPDTPDDGGGPSPVFLIAGGLIVATFLVLLVIVILLLSSGDKSENEAQATSIAATNDAVRLIFAATSTRQAVVFATETENAAQFIAQGTAGAIASGTAEAATVEAQLDASRTAIAVEATQTESAIVAAIRSTGDAETATVIALTPTTTPSPIPPTAQILVQDAQGNPLPEGAIIIIYEDNGDGIFNPATPSGPTPTPPMTRTYTPTAVTPTNTPVDISTLIPSMTPTLGATAAGFNYSGGGDRQVFLRIEAANPPSNPNQDGPTPTATPSADVQVATLISNPDGSFTLIGLPPGNYWIVINGEPIQLQIPDVATLLEIPTSGSPISIFVIPNFLFPTLTPSPSNTPIPTATLLPAEQTLVAQMTLVALENPTLQTREPDLNPTIAAIGTQIALTDAAQGPDFTPPATIDDTGFFDDLAENATPSSLTFLATLGAALFAGILVIRRLRSAL